MAGAPAIAVLAAFCLGSLAIATLALSQARQSRADLEALRARLERIEGQPSETALSAASPEAVRENAEEGQDPDFFEQLAEAIEAGNAGVERENGTSSPRRDGFAGGRRRFGQVPLLFTGDPEQRLAAARRMNENAPQPLQFLAARTLLELAPEEGIARMQELIADAGADRRSQRVAAAAVEALAGTDAPEIERQLYALAEGESRLLRRAAARGLESRGDPEPMRRLVEELSLELASPDGGVRGRTAQELGRTGSAVAVQSLLGLVDDRNSEVRLRAAEALGRTGAEAAIPELTRMLDDPVAQVRDTAARSLDTIRNPRPERMTRFVPPGP